MKDGGDVLKKRGWFSKKTKSTPQTISGPPTAILSGTQIKSPRSSIGVQDDLPPREPKDSTSNPPQKETSSLTTDSTEARESTNEVPFRAGFDFDAIKEVLGKVGNDPEGLHMLPSHPSTLPTTYSPVMRSVSAPRAAAPDFSPTLPTRSSSLASPSLEADVMTGPVGHRSFARSASFHGNREELHGEQPSTHLDSSPYSSIQARSASSLTLSFSGSDGTPWSTYTQHDLPSVNPAFDSREPTSFTRSATTFRANSTTTYAAPPALDNPFAAFTSAPALSFGAPDGSITSVNPILTRDPWEVRETVGDSGKVDSLSSNPWQN